MEIGPKEIEEITGLLQKTGVGAVAIPFINKALGPAADQIGSVISTRLKGFDPKKVWSPFIKAAQMLYDVNIEANSIKPSILIPLAESAALEDNELLGDKWAALLANAAAYSEDAVQPAFVDILKQITPRQARILDFMFNKNRDTDGRSYFAKTRHYPMELLQYLELDINSLTLINNIKVDTENLVRLRLCIPSEEMSYKATSSGSNLQRFNTKQTTAHDPRVGLSRFGFAFMLACTPPASSIAE